MTTSAKFYGEYDPYWFEDRKYPYLNENTMSRIVDDITQATLFILNELKHADFQDLRSTAQILPQEYMQPYKMPLGDL
jgi:hypothetical protein